MEPVKNFIILNIFIFLVVSSSGRSTSENNHDDSNDYYSDVNTQDKSPESDRSSINADSQECQEPITYYVNCELTGVSIILSHGNRNGEFYVEGYSENSKCLRKFSSDSSVSYLNISFNECGLIRNSIVRWNITVLPNQAIFDDEAVTIPMDCPYPEHNSTVIHEVPQGRSQYKHDHSTNRTESPKPNHKLNVTTNDNKMIAVIKITPNVGGARAENCILVNNLNETFNLTDDKGCPIDPRVFPGWTWHKSSSTLTVTYTSISLKNGPTSIHCHVISCVDTNCIANCPKEDVSRRKCKTNAH